MFNSKKLQYEFSYIYKQQNIKNEELLPSSLLTPHDFITTVLKIKGDNFR